MAYSHYFYPTTTSSTTTSSTRQYSPGLLSYYHHSNYLNPVNNYYYQYQNQYRYRWPSNYYYNYAQPYAAYDYSNTVNEANYYNNPIGNSTENTKSTIRSNHKNIKYVKHPENAFIEIRKHSSENNPKQKSNAKRNALIQEKQKKKIDDQKNKENIKMQLISQLTNQTQIELNKLIELKNKRRQITYLGIVTANPSDYVKKYGKDLIEPVNNKEQDKLLVLEAEKVQNKVTKQIEKENHVTEENSNLTSITVEPSFSSSYPSNIRNLNQAPNINNERTYKLAVDENGQFSLKAI